MSGNIFGCHTRNTLLASSWWRLGMLLNMLQHTGLPLPQRIIQSQLTSVMIEKPECRLVILAAKCSISLKTLAISQWITTERIRIIPVGVVVSGGKFLSQDILGSESKYKLQAEKSSQIKNKVLGVWQFQYGRFSRSAKLPYLVSFMVPAKTRPWGTHLVVQWLRLCHSNAEGAGSIPGWGDKIIHASCPKNKKSAAIL